MLKKSLLLIFSCVFLFACTHAKDLPTPAKPLVLLISIDGFKPDYLQRGITPTLSHLIELGASAEGLIPPFPSLTFPSHYSMVTGLYPDHHGIVNNKMIDNAIPNPLFQMSSRDSVTNPLWWKDGIPIWVSMQQQGKIASVLFWPGSEAKNQGIQPTDWLAYDAKLNSTQRVNLLLSWLNRADNKRADLATLYFSEVDTVGHQYGPDSEEVNQAIIRVDRALNYLLQQLESQKLLPKTTLLIVSDHGMADIKDKQQIDLSAYLKNFPNISIHWQGALAGFNFPEQESSAIFKQLSQEKHIQCWRKNEVPAKFHFGQHHRIPKGLCLAEVGWLLTRSGTQMPRGQHGFDPTHPDMHGIFIAVGEKIIPQKLKAIENIEVYPLLCQLLAIACPITDAQGKLLSILR